MTINIRIADLPGDKVDFQCEFLPTLDLGEPEPQTNATKFAGVMLAAGASLIEQLLKAGCGDES